MAISTYAGLQTAATDFMDRSDISGRVTDFITLAEARLNRKLRAVETDQTLTGTVDSRIIDVSAYSVVTPKALFLVDTDGDEVELTPKSDGTFPYRDTSGEPKIWSLDGTNIKFDRPLDSAYTFRFEFTQRFTLSDSSTTNWLLTNYPDVYLAATILWGGAYVRDQGIASSYKVLLDEAIPEIRNIIAQKHKALLTVDPALAAIAGGRSYADWESDT